MASPRFDSLPSRRFPVSLRTTLSSRLGWAEGFEPSATGTTIRRSTKLSYAHREVLYQFIKGLLRAANKP